MILKNKTILLAAALATLTMAPQASEAITLRVSITNLAPTNGTFLTPMWFGLHNGGFDLYDSGVTASAALERIAEDGNAGPLNTLFATSGFGTNQGVLNAIGAIGPGQTTFMNITVDGTMASNRYFSYASMIIPSNDAFIANGNPLAFQAFDGAGNFTGIDFTVAGSMVLDAGTEVNDELPSNTAFFGQSSPNTGVNQNGVVGIHGGFNPVSSGGILASPMFANADFKQPGYNVARIRVEAVPEPASISAIVLGIGAMLRRRK